MGAWRTLNKKFYKRTLKAWFAYLCKEKSHIGYYHFIQQYEKHFNIDQAIKTNYTSFAILFISKNISICWIYHKVCHYDVSKIPIFWSRFNAFLMKKSKGTWVFYSGYLEQIQTRLSILARKSPRLGFTRRKFLIYSGLVWCWQSSKRVWSN